MVDDSTIFSLNPYGKSPTDETKVSEIAGLELELETGITAALILRRVTGCHTDWMNQPA